MKCEARTKQRLFHNEPFHQCRNPSYFNFYVGMRLCKVHLNMAKAWKDKGVLEEKLKEQGWVK